MKPNTKHFTRFWLAVVIVSAIISLTGCVPLPAQDYGYKDHHDTIRIEVYPDGSDWNHPGCMTSDTIPITIYAVNQQSTIKVYYDVRNPYDDSLTGKIDSVQYEQFPGWKIDDQYYTLRFELLESKYQVIQTSPREWYTIEGTTRQEIWYDGQMYVIDSGTIYFQGKGHSK